MILGVKEHFLYGESAKKKMLFFLRDYHSNIKNDYNSRAGLLNYTHGIVGRLFILLIFDVENEINFFF